MAETADRNSPSRRRGKSESAFRTISEVAEELDLPQHVLRFWETKFVQIKPLKRGGGRRYYRPEDVALLRRIRGLLYDDGYTIRGVQKLFKQNGGKIPDAVSPQQGAEPDPQPRTDLPVAQAASPVPSSGLSESQRAELTALLESLEEIRDLLRKNGG